MPYEATPVFFIAPTNRYKKSFRRYASHGKDCCPGRFKSFHNASPVIETVTADEHPRSGRDPETETDPRWPTKCEGCDYEFTDEDTWQVFYEQIYAAADGREVTLRDAPPGACWDAYWFYTDRATGEPEEGARTGPDGRYLIVICPNGQQWTVDGRASNCTMRDDETHRCWVRHGRPEDGTLHVDKNGHTCAAGAGSILAGDYHGFLHNGWLTAG